MGIQLNSYAKQIHLFEAITRPGLLTAVDKAQILPELCEFFIYETTTQKTTIPETHDEQRRLLRALLNVRPPRKIPGEIMNLLDRFLWTERNESGIIETALLQPAAEKMYLWRGDICRLNCDAIVNAANNKLLGCFQPLHSCIDNAIHTSAGPRVREDCAAIMMIQGADEETGNAKITRAYNLPARFILHTVGPIVQSALQNKHKQLLVSCYRSCLDLAAETKQIQSIAFCCISTGVFGFPAKPAAKIAVETVRYWLQENPGTINQIIFNVFTENDFELYTDAFKAEK
jgi:O-acetyl-ADP-ribose deacetylase (regulator of RNase III)